MKKLRRLISVTFLCLGLIGYSEFAYTQPTHAAKLPAICKQLSIDGKASNAVQTVGLPPTQSCTTQMSNGFPIPDPGCTPGAINPTVTLEVLQDKRFKTACVRDQATTPKQKATTYQWYHTKHPAHNTGPTQTCELDHFISLELGGADTLDNLWPQCGPSGVTLTKRYFKQKDLVENYLAAQVKAGSMDLADAQKGIATDWTQYLEDAKKHFAHAKK